MSLTDLETFALAKINPKHKGCEPGKHEVDFTIRIVGTFTRGEDTTTRTLPGGCRQGATSPASPPRSMSWARPCAEARSRASLIATILCYERAGL